MAMHLNKDGIKVQFFDETGTKVVNEQTFSHNYATGRDRTEPTGSGDWVNQVYLANSHVDLQRLLTAVKPTGFVPLGTSLSSKNVTLITIEDGQPKAQTFACATGNTDDVVKSPDLPGGFLVVLQTLKVCPTAPEDLPRESPLAEEFGEGSNFFI
jgi:hypothetical protein